jgi:hypothetical protein
MLETELVKLFVAHIPFHIPDCSPFIRSILDVITNKGYRARAGIPGQADVFVYAKGGKVVEIEAKTATGRVAEAQKSWRARCLYLGIPHMIVRAQKGEKPMDTVLRWISELKGVLNCQK